MKGRDLIKLGFKPGKAIGVAISLIEQNRKKLGKKVLESDLAAIAREPNAYKDNVHWQLLAEALIEETERKKEFVERAEPAPYAVWGDESLEAGALDQMKNAARLPVAVAGALMPDAHQGYGLPIGGVLGTENAVIPYAVGVDIACRMKLTVFDIPATDIKRLRAQLVNALRRETVFGTGAGFKKPEGHEVLDEDWSVTDVTKRVFDKARAQLGSSGSGNHFVEFGVVGVQGPGFRVQGEGKEGSGAFGEIPEGEYLALLSHSGSRGAGATVADYYSRLAMDKHPELPAELRRLAWLDLNSQEGLEYWHAMNLMGKYASANHAIIHRKIARVLGAQVIAGVENHHNFAWKETHNGREMVVHRKGATPAGTGVYGVIPGSMASPGFVVRGKGVEKSLQSASHGAGRKMSRTQARNTYRWNHVKPILEEAGVELLSAGIDENPYAYKDIHVVMKQQEDLVEVVARFDPKIVRMAEGGEKPED
ncbi:MAG TPA: RtcB family protein [Tepidisphaeraceae bacterium]|jgi:tRNA-splicing ligase RtcB